jgi:mRNA-degrading endonuclease RelE of RelBE toxin-antitoxin system
MYGRLKKKIEEIHRNPEIGIPKKHHLIGHRGVHVGHFVILYVWDESRSSLEIMDISHHDDAYH